MPDCTAIRKKGLRQIDPDEMYMTDIYILPLTTGLSFIGYEGLGIFFGFHSKKCPLKVDDSQNKNYQSWRKQIMSMNQPRNRLSSDKVSKF